MENNWLTIEKTGDSVILERCSQEATGEIVIPKVLQVLVVGLSVGAQV